MTTILLAPFGVEAAKHTRNGWRTCENYTRNEWRRCVSETTLEASGDDVTLETSGEDVEHFISIFRDWDTCLDI
jgi:hypothetical protein